MNHWHLKAPATIPTIAVIERTSDAAKEVEGRDKERHENGARTVPFGFARALEDHTTDSRAVKQASKPTGARRTMETPS
jgi:hypothetical protein